MNTSLHSTFGEEKTGSDFTSDEDLPDTVFMGVGSSESWWCRGWGGSGLFISFWR